MNKDVTFFAIVYGIIVSILQTISSYLNVDYGVIKVFFWVYVFAICFGTIKTLVLRQSYNEFLIRNWLLKTMLLAIPTLLALESSVISFLSELIDWFFYYFILAETSYVISCIISIHKRQDVTTAFSVGGLELIMDKISKLLEKMTSRFLDDTKNK